MEYVEINNIRYGFVKDYKHIRDLRLSFNKLTEATFDFSLENWYQQGFWADNYIPYSLLFNNEIISNVSITRMEFDFGSDRKTAVQIGTVMTHEKYRHKGLNKFIMEQVLSEWRDQSDFIYLFANDSVLKFYPKFNFEIIDEYQHSKTLSTNSEVSSARRLNPGDKSDRALLVETIKKSVPLSKISMRNNASLIMFYCLSYKKNSIYYVDKMKAIVIADFENDTFVLNDVFSKLPVELDDLLHEICDVNTKRVVLGFTPLNEEGFDKSLLQDGDALFVLKDKLNDFADFQCRFPILSRA